MEAGSQKGQSGRLADLAIERSTVVCLSEAAVQSPNRLAIRITFLVELATDRYAIEPCLATTVVEEAKQFQSVYLALD